MNTTLHQAPTAVDEGRIPGFDPVLVTVFLTLVVFGMVAVYSATIAQAFEGDDAWHYLRKNVLNVIVAVTAMLFAAFTPIAFLKRCAWPALVLSVLLLVVVLIPSLGVEINGSTRWLRLGGWVFQPSEFAELLFLIFLASYLADRHLRLNHLLYDVAPIVGAYLIIATLLVLEPDLGSVLVLGAVLMSMLFLSGLRKRYLTLFFLLSVGAIAALIWMEPYRVQRVMSFLNPWEDPYRAGFQLVQSLIALGRGEWFGVGLGASVQKLFYLPYASSDFLFAVIGEELGFVGLLTVMGLFLVMIWKIFHISWLADAVEDRFCKYLAQSIGMMIAISSIVNMGVNMGLLPTKGLTLPFMSEGGSSLVAYSIAIGFVLSINREASRQLTS